MCWTWLSTLLLGCGLLGQGPRPLVEGEGFFDRPFPDDRRTVEGRPELSGFPGEGSFPLIDYYLAEGQRLDGAGLNSPIYLRLEGPPDLALLPDPVRSTLPGASVMLINIDPRSPDYLSRSPITWSYQEVETAWQPEDLLSIQPAWGFPLRPATQYGVVYTRALLRPPRGWEQDWEEGRGDLGALRRALRQAGVEPEEVAYGWTFTTQDPNAEMAQLVRTLREAVPLIDLSQELTYTYAGAHFRAWSGTVFVPNFQHGDYPYLIEGGQFELDESGWATISGWSEVAFTFTLPPEGEMPEGGWPVVIYGHGTGGSYQSLIAADTELEVAAALGRAGLAGLSISLPFHGDRNRGEDETISSFNYLNPTSGRCTFRQAAAEQLWLAELLSQQETSFFAEATGGGPGALYARVDPGRIGYLGHSHGGEIGAIAAPFFGDRVQAVVLSGTGGGLSLSIVHRKNEDFDIQGILEGVLAFDEAELLSEHHPVVGLVQTLTEVTDPINYAPYWHRWTPSWEGAAPMHVLEFEGLQDEYTPPIATEALAGAAGNPVLEPVAQTSLSQELDPEMRQPSPAIANVRSWSGARVTGGLVQYPEHGHFAMEEDLGAADMYAEFLRSALAGELPIIEERP